MIFDVDLYLIPKGWVGKANGAVEASDDYTANSRVDGINNNAQCILRRFLGKVRWNFIG